VISWPPPSVPAVPGSGPPVHLYDRRTDSVRAVRPGPVATTYACGVTPYDSTHIGHAATYVAADLLHRALLDAGHELLAVQNVTDVDDPLLERATRDGVDWRDLAADSIALFRDDMTALAVLPPTHYLGVVESMPTVVAAVQALVRQGVTYALVDESGARDVYLDLSAVPATAGVLSGHTHAEMVDLSHARGGDPDRPGKRDPIDPLLWRGERPGEPAWDGEDGLGPGRPGWHIECTALAVEHLGAPFDVQIGGLDLVFPHHEMSALQATALTGEDTYAEHHLYQALVGFEGEKMSKSKGNLVFVSRLRGAGVDPMAIRALLLAEHYRAPWEFTDDLLDHATQRLARWRAALSVNAAPEAESTVNAMRRAIADDLDSPTALMAVDRWAERTLELGGSEIEAPGLLARAMDALLGLRL
jgi:L-cysteine:1D-myo-inositol 2-amino-2-deoxy-alpha-D-glucopyranoside ligase